MSQHTCGRCGKVLDPVDHPPKEGVAKTGSTEAFRCACGNQFAILSQGRLMLLLAGGGFLTLGGLTILGMGPGHPDLTLKGAIGFVIGLLTFIRGMRARAARNRNPPVGPPLPAK